MHQIVPHFVLNPSLLRAPNCALLRAPSSAASCTKPCPTSCSIRAASCTKLCPTSLLNPRRFVRQIVPYFVLTIPRRFVRQIVPYFVLCPTSWSFFQLLGKLCFLQVFACSLANKRKKSFRMAFLHLKSSPQTGPFSSLPRLY